MLTRRLARPLLASVFIAGGIDQLRRPSDKAAVAAPLLDAVHDAAAPAVERAAGAIADPVDRVTDAAEAVAERAPVAVDDPVVTAATDAAAGARTAVHELADGRRDLLTDETLVRINGAVQVGAGLLLATNRVPRLASAALAVTLVPTTLAGHRWWEEEGTERELQRFNFLKNVALLGGLVLAAGDTDGAPSVAWRLRRANREGAVAMAAAAGRAAVLAPKVQAAGHTIADRAAEVAADLGPKVQAAGHTVADRAAELGPKVQAAGHTVADRAAELAPKVQAAAQRATASLPTPA